MAHFQYLTISMVFLTDNSLDELTDHMLMLDIKNTMGHISN